MINLLSFSDNDNYLEDLTTEGSDLIMTIRTWENSLQSVRFVNYRGLKDKQSSGVKIGKIGILLRSAFLDEIVSDNLHDGIPPEIAGRLRSFSFKGFRSETVVLEIIAEDAILM